MRRPPVLLALLLCTLIPSRSARADHDDGDRVKEYRYLLQFDAAELSAFAGYVILDSSEMDSRFEAVPRLGDEKGKRAVGANAIALVYEGNIPATIEALPGRDLLVEAERWIRAEASRSPDRTLWRDDEVVKRFESAFGGRAHRLTYERSPLLAKMLGIAKCKVHFLEGPKDLLAEVREEVTLRYGEPGRARIVPVRYVLRYRDGSSRELSPEAAARLTPGECRALLNPPGAKAVSSAPEHERAWPLAAPSFAALMLAGLAIRRRRDGS